MKGIAMKKITALSSTKKMTAFAATAVFGLAAVVAEAAPAQYAFHAQYTVEGNSDLSPVTNPLFHKGDSISGSFLFDASAPAVATNVPGTGLLAQFGQYSVYLGSILQLTGTAGIHNFSADTGSTLVANSTNQFDGVFNLAGTLNGDTAGTGFSGFAIDGFSLKSFNLFNVGGQYELSSQSLPSTLTLGPINAGIDLVFEDAEHRERTVMFRSYVDVAEVPVPAAGWMFGATLAGLLRVARRTQR
jgi:hypothetical protein